MKSNTQYRVILNGTHTVITLQEIRELQREKIIVTCDLEWYITNGGINPVEYKEVFLNWLPTSWKEFKHIED